MRHYNKDIESNSLKQKGLIVEFTGKDAYISYDITVHSYLCLPLSSCNMLPLTSNTLDIIRKEYEELRLFLIDGVSLISFQLLYNIDRRLQEIMHILPTPFANLDIIFFDDLCQAQLLHNCWIFEHLSLKETTAHSFWRDNVIKCELR